MTATQWLLNIGLLVFILATNLGTRTVTPRRLLFPLVLAAAAGALLLTNVPVLGNDVTLDAIAAGAGLILGVLAGLLMRIRRAEDGTVSSTAGTPYAVLWLVVIGGRVAFAEAANGWAQVPVREFSLTHEITGADAWTAAFTIMALTMVAARVATSYIRAKALPGPAPAFAVPSTLPGRA